MRPLRPRAKTCFGIRFSAASALLLGALFALGCGETVIDSSKAEGAIKSNLEKSLHEKISAVDCPSGQKVEPGKTFSCSVDFSNGKQGTATLKIRNEEADVSIVGLKQTK